MKRTFITYALASLSLIVTVQAAQIQGKNNQSIAGAQRTVAALEQQWADAAKANDPDAIAPLLADNFVNTVSDGRVLGKAETVGHAKTQKWETNQISDVKVTVFGNTAIATGSWAGRGADETGNPVNTRERWTDTWIRMPGGKWQCVASHSSTLKK